MKIKSTKIHWKSIALFYAITLCLRAIVHNFESHDDSTITFWTWGMAEGIGPCLGAIAAVMLFKRKFYCTITGNSLVKSIITVAIPLIVCFILDKRLSFILLGSIVYAFLEEVGWRGYLQEEQKELNQPLQVFIVGTMWFLWHLTIGFNMSGLIFWGLLLFGAWGIGNVARDTRSLAACACFHTLYNFSAHGYFQFTPIVIVIYVAIIVSWIVIWKSEFSSKKLKFGKNFLINDKNWEI